MFILRQAFLEIPGDTIDAARIDGASDVQLFRLVCLPMVKPALATVVLLTFVDAWNSFLWPLIVFNDPNKQVVQIAIANTARPGLTPDFGLIFAGATIATLPALVVFLFLQRYFVEGVALTASKGSGHGLACRQGPRDRNAERTSILPEGPLDAASEQRDTSREAVGAQSRL